MLEVMIHAAIEDKEGLDSLISGIVPRLLGLNSVIMSAAGDELEGLPSLKNRLYGGCGETQAVA